MSHLKLFLLGPPRLERADEPLELNTRKSLALLAYLAVSGQAHRREALTTLLWPNSRSRQARSILRTTLSGLNKLLAGQGLLVARQAVLTTLTEDGYFTPEADTALRQVVNTVPVLLRTFVGHTNHVRAVAFSPDGQTIVTASDDGSALVWDVETRSVTRRLGGHTDKVLSAAFSPDGQTIVPASADKTARLWPSVEQLLAEAASLIQRDPPEFTPEERTRFGLEE